MNPYPLLVLNHLQVPVTLAMALEVDLINYIFKKVPEKIFFVRATNKFNVRVFLFHLWLPRRQRRKRQIRVASIERKWCSESKQHFRYNHLIERKGIVLNCKYAILIYNGLL